MKLLKYLRELPIHRIMFFLFSLTIPVQTRIIFNPDQGYIGPYFSYYQAFFLYFSDILLIATIVSWLAFDFPSNILQKRSFRLILAFLGLLLVSLFHVKRLDLGLYAVFKWLELWLLTLYLSETFKIKGQFEVLFGTLFVLGTTEAILGIIQFHMQHSLGLKIIGEYIAPLGTLGLATVQHGSEKLIRAYGTMPHPNILAGFLLVSLIYGFYFVSRGTRINKWLAGLMLMFLYFGIFFTFSRLIWFLALTATGSFIIFSYYKERKLLFIPLIALLVSCGTIFAAYGSLATDWAAKLPDSQSVTLRETFNERGLSLMQAYLLLGVGPGNYIEALKDKYPNLADWEYQPPHNIFILLAAELGILGVSLFLIILFEIFKPLLNVPYQLLSFLIFTAGFLLLIIGLFDHYLITIQQGSLVLFTALGLLSALGKEIL
ncbi:MAG TPA: O-antigen ligase family protein [Patescibacteria group bacterium]|jgi:hypothetical protein|nr:O-antigen ligase family protein [Patescibacteria group bacterium]